MKSIVDTCYERAKNILIENRDKLDAMAEALLLYETIDREQIDDIMAGRKPRPPKDWDDPENNPVTPESGGEEQQASDADPRGGTFGGPAGEH